jgi:membrane protease YdiL (CAAX protease family)
MLMKKNPGLLFIVLAFIFTWSIEIPAALTKHGYTNITISKGLQIIATLAPGIVAILLSLLLGGGAGLKAFFKPILKWRVGISWYLVVLGIGILLTGVSILIFYLFVNKPVKPDTPVNLLAYLLILVFFSPFWEEIGWRGFLLPNLQKKHSAFKAALIIGFVWGLWHLPIILAGNAYGDQTIYYFLIIFIGCFALSILQTWLFNCTNSLIICILLHDAVNSGAAYFYGNLGTNELRPFVIFTALLILTAIIVLVKTKGKLCGVGRKMATHC